MIATAFLGTTLQARIDSTQDLNKDSYLRAIADRIVTNAGSPHDWGKSDKLPSDLGLALNSATSVYELDIDKISRLSNLNIYSLSHLELAAASKLSNIALGIEVSQIMTINLEQTNTYTAGADTYSTLAVSTYLESKPVEANLQCYLIAQNYQYNATATVTESGTAEITVHYPTAAADDALLVVFANVPFDERLTSYTIYNFGNGSQETTPTSTTLSLSPLNYSLSFNQTAGASVQKVYTFSYAHQYTTTSPQDGQCVIPHLIDHSPIVLIVCAQLDGQYFQEWTSYPQIPLTAGSSFANSERHVFSSMVTINGVLYKLNLSLGDVNP
ncbi:MAG: hypothetical protein M1540_06850 [Candidatus Bathyarchaeota archaeon]|nr:hypothetical protein [Candidatus Bathyarchaeota archaeon]